MYVYIIKSQHQNKPYIGKTKNLKQRLSEHNAGKVPYTSQYKPWVYTNFFWFNDDKKACAFERYLKSGSGRAFANKHF